MKSKVLSVRVPENFAKELSKYCKQNDTSVSEYLQKGFTKVGMMDLAEVKIEESIKDTLITVGSGSAIGILAYKGVKAMLINKKFDDSEIELYSTLSGIVCGIVTTIGVKKLLKSME